MDYKNITGIEAFGPLMRRLFISAATKHMNAIANPKKRKECEPKKVTWDNANKCFEVTSRNNSLYHYTLNGSWY